MNWNGLVGNVEVKSEDIFYNLLKQQIKLFNESLHLKIISGFSIISIAEYNLIEECPPNIKR